MEYNKMIELARQSVPSAPDTDEVLDGIHRRLRARRQRQMLIASAACLLIAALPLALLNNDITPSPTLVETVSATVKPALDNLPAPLAGYRNSLRNHQTTTVI